MNIIRARMFIQHIESGFAEDPNLLRGILTNEQNLAPMLYAIIAADQNLESPVFYRWLALWSVA